MKRVLFRIFLLCAILTLFVACGSDAQPEEPTPTEVTPTPAPAPAPAPVVEPEPAPVVEPEPAPVVEPEPAPAPVVEPEPVVAEPETDWAAVSADVTKARNAALVTGARYYDALKDYFDGVDAAYNEFLATCEEEDDVEKFNELSDSFVILYATLGNLGKAQSDCNLAYACGYDEYDVKNAMLGEDLFNWLEEDVAEVLANAETFDTSLLLGNSEALSSLLAASKEIADTYAQLVANGEAIDEIIDTYFAAEEAGAAELFPGDFEAVADLAVARLEYYNTEGTQKELDEDLDTFLNVSKSFVAACEAWNVYNDIYDNGLEGYDYKNIALGDAAIDDGYALIDKYYDENIIADKDLLNTVTFIRDSYQQSLDNAYAMTGVLATREDAIEAGADEFYPEYFAAADDYAYEAHSYFNDEGGSQAELDADIANLNAIYGSFAKAVALEDTYAYIISEGFNKYDVKNFNAGSDAVAAVYDMADSVPVDGFAISAKLDEADAYYSKVISNGNAVGFVLVLREDAVNYGACDYLPEGLDFVDEYADYCLVAYNEGGSQDDLDADIENCSYLYNSLIVAVDAQKAYDYIIENGYDEYDSKDVVAGDKAVADIYDLAEIPDGEAIFKTINVALGCYDQAIDNCERCLAVVAVRDEAIDAGAYDYFPEEFDVVDELAWEAVDYFNAGGSQEELDADIDNFDNIYTAFITAAEAKDVYDVVVENGYDEYDVRNFEAGLAAEEEVYELAVLPLDGEALLEKTGDVKYYYTKILDNVDRCLAVLDIRDEAIEAGAYDYFTEEFDMVDELAWEAVDYYNEAGSQEELDADIENFKNIYVAFIVAVGAQDAYDVVIEEGYDLYDSKSVELGNRADEKVYEIAYETFNGKDILGAVHEADDAYNQAIDNGQMIDAVIAVREEAVEAGADEYFPEELAMADEYAYDALDYYNSVGTQEELEADAENFTYVYKAFGEACAAADVYIRIVENDFQSYDRNGFAAAEKATDELVDLAYSLAEGKVLLAKAEEAHAAYNKVVSNAFKKKSDAVRSEYLAIKKDADGIKASVADKPGYTAAETHMKNAEAIFARMAYESAFSEYSTAKDAMSSVYASVLEKRNAAMEALERGRARAEELSILAAQADIIAPLSNN